MKLQLRFLLLVVFVFSAVAGLVAVQHQLNVDRSKALLKSEAAQREQYFASIVKLDGTSLKSFVQDYSPWDDMVAFVKTGNLDFAHQNIDEGVNTFGADAAWVYKPDGKLAYSYFSDKNLRPIQLDVPKAVLEQLKNNDFAHFYINTQNGIMEIRAATIVPSNDYNHETAAQGYFLVGRYYDATFTSNLSELTQGSIAVDTSNLSKTSSINGNSVTVGEILQDWSNKPLAVLRSSYKVSVVEDLDKSYSQQLRLIFVLSIILIVVSFLYIWRLVLLPMRAISLAIEKQQPNRLEPVMKLKTEFSELARTVKKFFDQKITIAKTEFEKTELEKLHKEKVAFLAVAAHELNGPVNAVRLFSEYVNYLIKHNGPQEKINLMLDRISRQINKANMLINDLHGAAQGVQNMQFGIKEIDFDKFLNEEIDQAAFTVKHKLLLTGSTGKKVKTDPDRLGQVVTNLLRNAYKYSPDADTIHITSKFENGSVVVGVQDFGLGISKADQQHIFERFYRSSNVAELFPGLGLGLAISKQIVERLGGKIWLQSVEGLGSTFYFSLPVSSDEPTADHDNAGLENKNIEPENK